MNRIIFLLLTLLAGVASVAQINYEPGYYVDNQNTTVNGFIRNIDWKDNPKTIEFRESEAAVTKTLKISDMSEFGIADNVTYKRFTVDIENSSSSIDDMSHTSAPQFAKETVLLKLLVSGAKSLYKYEKGNSVDFFIQSGTEIPQALVYKQYFDDKGRIAENNSFRQQLYVALGSERLAIQKFEKLHYTQYDLMPLFEASDAKKSVATKSRKAILHLGITAGVNFASMEIHNNKFPGFEPVEMDKTVVAIGIEAEYVLPFNKNKWSIFVNPSFQSFQQENVGSKNSDVDYKYIEIPIAIRHRFFTGDKSSVFINAGPSLALQQNSGITYETNGMTTHIDASNTITFFGGIGYNWRQFSAELRIRSKSDILKSYTDWVGNYNYYGIQVKYYIF